MQGRSALFAVNWKFFAVAVTDGASNLNVHVYSNEFQYIHSIDFSECLQSADIFKDQKLVINELVLGYENEKAYVMINEISFFDVNLQTQEY
jgi:hypothetical protein